MTVLATDNFDRANGADLGALWDVVPSTIPLLAFAILSNTAQAPGDPCAEMYNGVVWPADQYSQIEIITQTVVGDRIGCCVRASSGNLYLGGSNTSNVGMEKIVANSFSDIGSTGAAAALNDTLRLEAQGTAIRVYKNGVLHISTTDSSHATGSAGVFGSAGDINPQLDDWEGGAPDLPTGTIASMDRSRYPKPPLRRAA